MNESQAYMIIKSEDRDKSLFPSPANLSITPSQNLFVNTRVTSVEGESFEMLYDIPNINDRNNVIVFDDGATSYPITVPQNYYTYDQLGNEIQTQLNAVIGAGHIFGWVAANSRYELTAAPAPLKVTKYPPQKRDLAGLIGFAYDQPLSTIILGGASDITYTRNIYITSNNVHRSKRAQDQSSDSFTTDVIMVVPVYGENEEFKRLNRFATPYDTLLNPRHVYHQPTLRKQIAFNVNESISTIDILLLDDQGEELYNPHSDNPDWSYRWRLTIMANQITVS